MEIATSMLVYPSICSRFLKESALRHADFSTQILGYSKWRPFNSSSILPTFFLRPHGQSLCKYGDEHGRSSEESLSFACVELMFFLVGGLVAINFIFPLILGMSSSQLTFIFFRGVAKNHQPVFLFYDLIVMFWYGLLWLYVDEHNSICNGAIVRYVCNHLLLDTLSHRSKHSLTTENFHVASQW